VTAIDAKSGVIKIVSSSKKSLRGGQIDCMQGMSMPAKNLFTYDSANFNDTDAIDGDLFRWNFYPWDNNTVFGIIVLEDADDSITQSNPVVSSGDHVILTVNITKAFGGFGTNVDVYGQVIPEEGSPGIISFTTPAAYSESIIELQNC